MTSSFCKYLNFWVQAFHLVFQSTSPFSVSFPTLFSSPPLWRVTIWLMGTNLVVFLSMVLREEITYDEMWSDLRQSRDTRRKQLPRIRVQTQNQSEWIRAEMIYHWSILYIPLVLLSVAWPLLGPLYISELGTQDTFYVFWHQLLSYKSALV